MFVVPVWRDDTADLWRVCACVIAFFGGRALVRERGWSIQGDLNIYCCFPRSLDVSLGTTLSLPVFARLWWLFFPLSVLHFFSLAPVFSLFLLPSRFSPDYSLRPSFFAS